MSFENTLTAWETAIIQRQSERLLPKISSPADNVLANKALRVYLNNYQQTLLSVLQQTFCQCLKLIGNTCFTQLAMRYIETHPMQHSNLELYGEHFPLFLSKIPGMTDQTPYLPDTAHAEYLMHSTYFAEDRTDFPMRAFHRALQNPDNKIYLQMHRDIQLLKSDHPIHLILNKHCEPPAETGPYYFLVERPAYKPDLTLISEQEHQSLEALENNFDIESILVTNPEFASHMEKFLVNHWIGDFDVSGS